MPHSSRCVAKLCHKVWGDTRLEMPARFLGAVELTGSHRVDWVLGLRITWITVGITGDYGDTDYGDYGDTPVITFPDYAATSASFSRR